MNVDVLDWTGNSPDLNPIEDLWFILKNKIAENGSSNSDQLISLVKLVWTTEMTAEYCRKLIESMPRRLRRRY